MEESAEQNLVAISTRPSANSSALSVTLATTTTATATASVMGPACAATAATESLGELARGDVWFGWYFAPGGYVLGPALLLTVFLLGGALFEKVTGKPPTRGGGD